MEVWRVGGKSAIQSKSRAEHFKPVYAITGLALVCHFGLGRDKQAMVAALGTSCFYPFNIHHPGEKKGANQAAKNKHWM